MENLSYKPSDENPLDYEELLYLPELRKPGHMIKFNQNSSLVKNSKGKESKQVGVNQQKTKVINTIAKPKVRKGFLKPQVSSEYKVIKINLNSSSRRPNFGAVTGQTKIEKYLMMGVFSLALFSILEFLSLLYF
jgi:hypothetical protein